ncbi:MAG: hypothetical protein GF398_15300 [Chitinivibrionales bacterium]|nr:hypothetical protein [Chitinivibrionales bacterium]
MKRTCKSIPAPTTWNLLLSVCVVAVTAGEQLTEQDAIAHALDAGSQFRILLINRASDSLSTQSVESDELPQLEFDASYRTSFNDSLEDLAAEDLVHQAKAAVSGKKSIRGGGSVSGAVSETVTHDASDNQTKFSTAFGISYDHELLKNSGRYSSAQYAILIRRIDAHKFRLEQKKRLLGDISDVRMMYWNLYEKLILLDIAKAARDLAHKDLQTARIKHEIGEGSQLDTLSAALEFLRAQRRLLIATTSISQARRSLALAVGADEDSVEIDTARRPDIGDFPPPHEFISKARTFDPRLRIFETAFKKLQLNKDKLKNDMLPSARAGISVGRTFTSIIDGFNSDGITGAASSHSDNAVISLILSYNLPATKRRISIRQTEYDIDKNRLEQNEYHTELMHRIRSLLDSWRQEKEDLRISRAARAIAQKQLDAATRGFELGAVDNLSLLKARNDFIDTAVETLRKIIALKKLEITFDEITGESLAKFGVTMQ